MDLKLEPRTINDVALKMTEDEARGFLVDPEPLQKEVRALLAKHRAATDKRPGQLKLNGHRKKSGGAKLKLGGKLQCPHCPRTFSKDGFLKWHIRIKHPETLPEDAE